MQNVLLVTLVAGVLRQSQCCSSSPKGINLARDGQVTQSSLYNSQSYAEKAVDGNRNGDFSKGSCMHTHVQDNPWWRLEFRKSYKIGTIIVANRQECCAFQLVGAEVRVGNSLDNNNPVLIHLPLDLKERKKPKFLNLAKTFDARAASDVTLRSCGVITGTDHITTLCCNGMEGRYISIVIPGSLRVLHVCEVEVYEQDQESTYVCW